MELTINIKAPELVNAIESLAAALSNQKEQVVFEKIGNQPEPSANYLDPSLQAAVMTQQAQQVQQVQQPAPVTQQPIQQQVQQSVPTAVPTAPVQQTIQQAPPQPVEQTQPQAVPTSAPSYNMDQLAVAATQLMDAGKRNELLQLLSSFGVQALTQLPTEQYGAFATKLREMGARI